MSQEYFKSIDELLNKKSFQENWEQREFLPNPEVPGGLSDTSEGVSRREFVKLMAGGMALMSLTGCRRPESHIVPMTEQPENRVVGNPLFFASAQVREGEAIPLMVETHGGRPTKLEGNSRFGLFGGTTDVQAQAYVLDLYDPDRATRHYSNGSAVNKEKALEELKKLSQAWQQTQGEGLAVLAHPSTSFTTLAAKNEFKKKFPKAAWVEYSAFDKNRLAIALGNKKDVRVKYNLEKADRILSLDCDFIGGEVGSLAYAKAFAARRRPYGAAQVAQMNRLYVVESVMSLTGAQADHRLRLDDKELVNVAARLLQILDEGKSGLKVAKLSDEKEKWLQEMAADLRTHKGQSLVMCGGHQSVALQKFTAAINEVLGAEGNTLSYLQMPESKSDDLGALQEAKEIVVLGANPAFDAPAQLQWSKIAKKVTTRWAYRTDETSLSLPKNCLQVLSAHGLESWGLGAAFDGTPVAQQPLIEPLYQGVELLEFFATVCGRDVKPRQWTQEVFAQLTGQGSEREFNDFLNHGLGKASAYTLTKIGGLTPQQWSSLRSEMEVQAARAQKGGVTLLLRPSYTINVGEVANNAWLQELPDPMTKLTWGNALYVSASRAKELGYNPAPGNVLPISSQTTATLDRGRQTSPIVTVQIGEVTIKVPLSIQPGMPDDTVLINLGYGHTKFGRNAEGFGVNAFPFYASQGLTAIDGINLKLTNETVLLASTQNHWSIEGRDHYREGDKEDFIKDERFAQSMGVESHAPANYGADAAMPLSQRVKETPRGNSAFEHPNFTAPQQWGMTIDLGSCTGCNACVIACQSENNIPSVGKEQILKGREMHWIRIDRYYASGRVSDNNKEIPSDVDVGLQPMTCQHCERAPCEQVCPVNATVHDDQGLNVMAYNRCVGTRYCANNCPYKVRRFNFFDYAKRNRENYYWGMFGPEGMPDILKLQKNPDVTIRSRGVMEKCTFCVQRIEQAKIRQRLIARDSGNILVPDGVIKTACQQACPSSAIVFGDVADEKSEVYRLKHSPRDYSVLGYLNTRPRLTYLARIRNQNRAMPDYHPVVRFRLEQGMDKKQHHDSVDKNKKEDHTHAQEEAHH